jgi:hypothetical protein
LSGGFSIRENLPTNHTTIVSMQRYYTLPQQLEEKQEAAKISTQAKMLLRVQGFIVSETL